MKVYKRFAIDLILALAIFVLLRLIFLTEFTIKGNSMVPTLFPGERIFVLKFPQLKLSRGDIIVFLYPENPNEIFIKRIAGLPGEKISIRSGHLFVNGKCLKDPRIKVPKGIEVDKKIPLGFFFVLGDNSQVSNDSRYGWLVPEEFIRGKAIAVFWPLYDMRFLR